MAIIDLGSIQVISDIDNYYNGRYTLPFNILCQYDDIANDYIYTINGNVVGGVDLPNFYTYIYSSQSLPNDEIENARIAFQVQEYNVNYCDSGNYISFPLNERISYNQEYDFDLQQAVDYIDLRYYRAPYFKYNASVGDNRCEEVICDIQFSDLIEVVDTPEGTANGSITVTASSTYNLSSYTLIQNEVDLISNTSGVFTNLLAGVYQVRISDEKRCNAVRTIEVPSSAVIAANSFGLKYETEYTPIIGERTRIEIFKRGYTSTEVNELKLTGTPLIIDYGNKELFKDQVHPSVMKLGMISESNFSYHEFFTSNSRDFLIKFYKDGKIKKTGYLIPEQFSEALRTPPYPVEVNFNDGLSELKTIKYKSQNVRTSWFSLVLKILRETELFINVGIASELTAAQEMTVLHDIFIEDAVYEDKSLHDVLNDVLTNLSARIIQTDDRFEILGMSASATRYELNIYNAYGDFIEVKELRIYTNIFNPLQTSRGANFADKSQRLTITKPYRFVTLKRPSYARTNLINNGTFDDYEDIAGVQPIFQGKRPSNFDDWSFDNSGFGLIYRQPYENQEKNLVQIYGVGNSKFKTKVYTFKARGENGSINIKINASGGYNRYNRGGFIRFKYTVKWGDYFLDYRNGKYVWGVIYNELLFEKSVPTSLDNNSVQIDISVPYIPFLAPFGGVANKDFQIQIFTPTQEEDALESSFDNNNYYGKEIGGIYITRNGGFTTSQVEDDFGNLKTISDAPYIARVRDNRGDWQEINRFRNYQYGGEHFNRTDNLLSIFSVLVTTTDMSNLPKEIRYEEENTQILRNTFERDLITGTIPRDQDYFNYNYILTNKDGSELSETSQGYLTTRAVQFLQGLLSSPKWNIRATIVSKNYVGILHPVLDFVNDVNEFPDRLQGKSYLITSLRFNDRTGKYNVSMQEYSTGLIALPLEEEQVPDIVNPIEEQAAFTNGFTLGFEA